MGLESWIPCVTCLHVLVTDRGNWVCHAVRHLNTLKLYCSKLLKSCSSLKQCMAVLSLSVFFFPILEICFPPLTSCLDCGIFHPFMWLFIFSCDCSSIYLWMREKKFGLPSRLSWEYCDFQYLLNQVYLSFSLVVFIIGVFLFCLVKALDVCLIVVKWTSKQPNYTGV